MNRTLSWLRIVVIALTAALAFSQAVMAQRGEGGRGRGPGGGRGVGFGFGSPMVGLASVDDVQKELEMSDEQRSKVEELNEQVRDDFRKLLDSPEPEAMQKLNEDAVAKLSEILDEEQKARLSGITIQFLSAGAILANPELGKSLDVSAEQIEKLRSAQRENREAMGQAFREMRDLSREERREKFEEMRDAAQKKLMDVLSPEQQKQLDELKGEPVEIDFWRQGRGERRRIGRDGERGERRGRDRGDADASESESDESADSGRDSEG